MTFGAFEGGGSAAKLEILNDTPPLKAKLSISNVPPEVAGQFGVQAGPKAAEADDGVITADGAVMWTGEAKNFVQATLLDNKKLSLWYYFRGMRGDATLNKK